jgi:CrcB protein
VNWLLVNVAGCAVIGVFMVVIAEVWAAHRLVRPFFGTGVLGGFTTFSTYAVGVQRLVAGGRPATGLGYLAVTLLAALAAVWTAAWLTRRVIGWRQA